MSLELGRFLEGRRQELGLSRRDVAEQSGLSYPYVSQLETGDREPALKAMRALAPVLNVRVEELASMVAGGDWAATEYDAYSSTPPRARMTSASAPAAGPGRSREKVLLSLERRLRDVPPLDRIALLNELIAQAVVQLEEIEGVVRGS